MSTPRLQNWPVTFAAYLAQHRCTPFAWGTHDCCQFARRGIIAVRGVDPVKKARLGLRPYKTAKGAASALARVGGVAALPGRCGLVEIAVARAGRGDVVMTIHEGRETLGLCKGEMSVFVSKTGLVSLPTLSVTRAWKV